MLKLTRESHLDHGIPTAVLAHLLTLLGERDGFFVETVELPAELGVVPCALRGPAVGDPPIPDSETEMRRRGERTWESRTTTLPPTRTRLVTIIAGPAGSDTCVLYTVYGGPCAPQEPDDPNLDPRRIGPSMDFWATHALSRD